MPPRHRRSIMLPDSLLRRLRHARHVAVFTGAGISAESGIPTFRDRFEGLWAKYDPMDVANPWAFRQNPQFVWDWHVHLADKVRRAEPNAGHKAVARLQEAVPKVTVITQNVDNLHQEAGSRDVLELHGNLFRLKPFVDEDEIFGAGDPVVCHVCDGYASADARDPYAAREEVAAITVRPGPVPRCPGCGALLRPAVVWFGEMLDPAILGAAVDAADDCDVLICVGSSLEVEPAASLPRRALHRGALVIEVNPVPTSLSDRAAATLVGGAAVQLPRLLREAWGFED